MSTSEVEPERAPRANAPWTVDQVASLNAYQDCGFCHPFTGAHGVVLVATRDGWVEPTEPGEPASERIVQSWAHVFMADWSWRAMRQVRPL